MATNANRVLLRQMLGAVAQYDKTQIVARLRKKAQTGRCEGRKPYGFREGEQSVLERLRQLRAAGMPYYSSGGSSSAGTHKPCPCGAKETPHDGLQGRLNGILG